MKKRFRVFNIITDMDMIPACFCEDEQAALLDLRYHPVRQDSLDEYHTAIEQEN